MCDTYEGKCQGCGRPIPMHIADFSTDRRLVRVWCPQGDCHDDLIDWLRVQTRSGLSGPARWHLFTECVALRDDEDSHVLPGLYIFIVTDPHGIHVN